MQGSKVPKAVKSPLSFQPNGFPSRFERFVPRYRSRHYGVCPPDAVRGPFHKERAKRVVPRSFCLRLLFRLVANPEEAEAFFIPDVIRGFCITLFLLREVLDMNKTGAEIIVECLLEQGVDTVFGYPGGAVLNLYDALYHYGDKIKHVLTAHEQGASHAADGYARASGKTGVVIATSGPGATNLVTGLATAYMDSVPLVAITGNVSVPLLGRDSFQEVDITRITMPVTKHNFIVKDVSRLAETLREAFRIARSGRKGPVLVDVPKDVTAATADYERLAPLPLSSGYSPDEPRIARACNLIADARQPLIYAGGGVISSGASEELLRFAEKGDIPVACSLMGLGCFPGTHPGFLGLIGMHGTYAANRAAAECDLLLVCGARFSDRVAGDCGGFAPNARIIHIDIDPAEFDKNVRTDLCITADLAAALSMLREGIPALTHPGWHASLAAFKKQTAQTGKSGDYPSPIDIIHEVDSQTKGSAVVVTDVGQHQMWAAQTYCFTEPRTFLSSGGLGTMGFGLGAAIGAQMAGSGRRVVLFTGDGSFHMNLNEITTLVSYSLPVTVFVMNNRVLGMVRQWQKIFYGGRFSQTDPHRQTDFVKLAEAFGAKGLRISRPEEIKGTVRAALREPGPVVVDCRISPDANVLPMIPPGANVDKIMMDMD